MAPAVDTPRQQKCSGFFSGTLSSDGTTIDVSCFGVTSALRDSYVDLVEHETQRPPKPDPHSYLQNLSCVGMSVYQQTPDKNTGTIPAPACLGVEFQRFHHSMMAQQQHSAADHMHHMHGGSSMEHDIELLHAATAAEHAGPQQASSSSSSGAALPGPAEAYMRHAQQQQQQQQPQMINTADTSAGEYHGRPSLVQRLTELHAEASERLDGVDPLWFGKAFVARAALNWDSMTGMAGQVVESVKADLGFPPSKPSSKGPSDSSE